IPVIPRPGEPISGVPAPRELTPEEREAQRAAAAERTRVTATPLETAPEQAPPILRGSGQRAIEPPTQDWTGMPREASDRREVGRGPFDERPEGYPESRTAQRFEQYGETALTRDERQRAARQEYIDRMTPQWQKESDWLDKVTEDQIRKGYIQPGDM